MYRAFILYFLSAFLLLIPFKNPRTTSRLCFIFTTLLGCHFLLRVLHLHFTITSYPFVSPDAYFTDILAIPFQVIICILSIAASLHSIDYLSGHGEKHVRYYGFFFLLMLGSMLGVTLFANYEYPLAFLLCWELMGLSSAALVAFDATSKSAFKAIWRYLLACHAGAFFLFYMFYLPGLLPVDNPHLPLLVWCFAILGFGLKIGFAGLHVWLPDAHPNAPAPVSAIMSGAMIPLGFFGLVAFSEQTGIFSFVDKIAWCTPALQWTLLMLGILGALGGILFSLSQSNLKRLLAYSSIENMGIIAIGLSFCVSHQPPTGYAPGFMLALVGTVLHIFNHAWLKGGLFLGAGSIYHATGTLELDEMGGLMKRMPKTGTLFLLNSLGITGLPPFCAFVSELLIFLAAFTQLTHAASTAHAIAALLALLTLALVGGLSCVSFTKAVGAAFLGEPRSPQAEQAREVSATQYVPILILFVISVLTSLLAVTYCFSQYSGLSKLSTAPAGSHPVLGLLLFALIVVLLVVGRWVLLKATHRKAQIPPASIGPTWDCGYAKPTARMAYTATAFAQPVIDLFSPILRPIRRWLHKPKGLFPRGASIQLDVPDAGTRFFWDPIFKAFTHFSTRLHVAQSGHVHAYLLVMVIVVLLMLAWAIFSPVTVDA